MAVVYAVSEFTDEKGTTWKVKIVDGTISTGDLNHAFTLGPDGFRLTYDFDNFDRAKPILGSRVQITLFHNDSLDTQFNTLYSNLDTAEEGTYRLEIYRDPDGDNEAWWIGEILPEQTIISDEFPSAAVTITAVDGLGNLKGIDYNNNGAAYTGTNNIAGHLYAILSKVHSANFWGASDKLCYFFEDFIGKEYKDHIAGGTAKQLQNAWVRQESFHNLNEEGVKEYYSAYEVLESICKTFNSCIFMANGRFWFLPLGALQHHGSSGINQAYYIQGGGVVVYSSPVTVNYSGAFGNNSADFEKLAGWERSSTPAFKEVKRTRDYQGDKPNLFSANYTPGTLLSDEDAVREQSTQFLVSGRLNYYTAGISGYTSEDAIARIKLSITLRVGDAGGTNRYLKRLATFNANAQDYFTVGADADNYFYYLPQYADPTWDASSASRLEIICDPFDVSVGYAMNGTAYIYTGNEFTFTTAGIPADANGLQIQVDVSAIDHDGNTVAAWTDSANADVYISDLGVYNFNGESTQEFGTVDVVAKNSQSARYKLDQGNTLIGDKISDPNNLGIISVYNGTDNVPSTEWTNLQNTTSGYSINKLGVVERLAANKNSRRTERGTLYKVGTKYIQPYSVLTNSDEGTVYYQVTSLTHIAARCEYDVECMFLSRDISDITVGIENKQPSKGDPYPTVAIGQKGPTTGAGGPLPTINTKSQSITIDSYGITDLKISDGSSGTWDFGLPTAAAAAGKTQPMSIRDDGNVVYTTIGTAGQVLTVNATATGTSFADASGGESGWFNSTTLMKVMPTEFMGNDDGGYAVIEDDTSDKLGVKISTTATELFVTKAIPTGYKATHVQVYASGTESATAVRVRNFDHTDGDLSNETTGDFNASIDILDITSSATQNIMIKVTPGRKIVYGADITIAAV